MEYVRILTDELQKRKAKNSSYSIRAFAKQLGVQSATLSAVLNKKRHLSFKDAEQISGKLFRNEDQSKKFILDVLKGKTQETDYDFLQDDSRFFPVVAQWEYRAILTLMDTVNFVPSAKWISDRLGFEITKTQQLISYLVKIGLLQCGTESGVWTKNLKQFAETSRDIISAANRMAHENELGLALEKQKQLNVSEREFNSLCFAAEKKDLPKIKKQIRDFLRQLERTYETKNADEVYILGCQFFPLTRDI